MAPIRVSTPLWSANYVKKLLIGMSNTPIQQSGRKWSHNEMEELYERMEITNKIFQWLVKAPEGSIRKCKKRMVKKFDNWKTSTVNHKPKASKKEKGQEMLVVENVSGSQVSPDVTSSSGDAVSVVANAQIDLSEWYTLEDLMALDA